MTNQLWSWVMGGLGLTALWLAGSARTRAGSWLFGAALQAAWVVYVALTAQYGLVLPCAIAVAINWRNFRTERRERAATAVARPRRRPRVPSDP